MNSTCCVVKGLNKNDRILELTINDKEYRFNTDIASAQESAELQLQALNDTIDSIKGLKPECDKLDYALAASSGVLCGIIDIFGVGKPNESPLGDLTDKWFNNRIMDFAKLCERLTRKKGDDKRTFDSLSKAISFLEDLFEIPYDQTGLSGASRLVFGLHPSNHHFKSLAHNPSLLGLFFSILDQFTNSSHFVSGGNLISLQDAKDNWELQGKSIPGKIFCGFVNWIGHLLSDVAGSESSAKKGNRGAGIPSPLWTWTNDIIAIKRLLNIEPSEFDKSLNDLALTLYEKGFDARFQATQAIPVIINELIVRFMYSTRRLVKYFSEIPKESRSFELMWKSCEPFSNLTVKRMITVAHGVFCLMDVGDATVRGFAEGAGSFNVVEFFLRLNVAGVGKFTISLYGEVKQGIYYRQVKNEVIFAQKEKAIVLNYIEGLKILSERYDDKYLLTFVEDFQMSDMYKEGFKKTVNLANLRNVPTEKVLRTKQDIDAYFTREKK